MTHYRSNTQPRRAVGRTHPPLPPLSTLPHSTLPHSTSLLQDIGGHSTQTMGPRTARPFSASTTPRHHVTEGDYSLTRKILSTASQTGSTRDLRLLLNDALALTEKLDSVSVPVGRGSSSSTSHRLSSSSVFPKSPRSPKTPKSPGTYSETRSVFRSHSVDNGLDHYPRDPTPDHYETSASLAATIATPVRKTMRPTFQNGYSSPPPPPSAATLVNQRSSPLLNDKRGSSGDYAVSKSAKSSRPSSQKSGSAVDEGGPSSRSGSQGEQVDAGFDYIAQLEALEKELRSYRPADSPQRSKGHSLGSSQGSSSQDSHYEVDPDYMLGKKEKSTVPPSQRVGGRPSVADFVDELTEVEDQVSRGPEDSQQTRGMTSSTATRELDELMANLENFEPASAKTDQSQSARDVGRTKSTAMDNLNSMLGSLDEDMTKRHGVKTAPKGVCAACNKPILTKVVNALGCQWHKEHFTCAQCDVELGSSTYYESNGRPYCEKDYHELFAPRCAYCNGPILERVLRALGKTWHKEHFFCTLCGKDFGPEGFHEKDSKAFCRECYYEKFAPRCKRCEQAIMEGFITALSSQWHPECFCCKVCGVTFPRGNYFDHEGEPHCEIHYHASRGTLCASCQKPVTGKCITAMGKKWHPEHFTCAFCLKLLNKGTFKEHRHNPYCQSCYIKLFG